MAKTVTQEMPDDERRERLFNALKACGSGGEVAIETSHLIQAVGLEVAEKLIITSAETLSLVSSTTSRTSRLRSTGICSVDRDEALQAVEAALEAAKAPKKKTGSTTQEPPAV